jgi:hypothetical protein
MYDGVTSILSKYVGLLLVKAGALPGNVVAEKRNVLLDPTWQDMAAEFHFLYLIENYPFINLRSLNGTVETWPRRRIYMTETGRDRSQSQDKRIKYDCTFADSCSSRVLRDPATWLIPLDFNPCFEALYRVSSSVLRAVQITATSNHRHSCELQELIPYVREMSVHRVEMVYVCRADNFNSFLLPHPEIKPPRGRARPIARPKAKVGAGGGAGAGANAEAGPASDELASAVTVPKRGRPKRESAVAAAVAGVNKLTSAARPVDSKEEVREAHVDKEEEELERLREEHRQYIALKKELVMIWKKKVKLAGKTGASLPAPAEIIIRHVTYEP